MTAKAQALSVIVLVFGWIIFMVALSTIRLSQPAQTVGPGPGSQTGVYQTTHNQPYGSP